MYINMLYSFRSCVVSIACDNQIFVIIFVTRSYLCVWLQMFLNTLLLLLLYRIMQLLLCENKSNINDTDYITIGYKYTIINMIANK